MAYTNDFIQRVLKVQKHRNLSYRKTANLFQIGTTTLANWKKGLFPEGKRNRKPKKIHDDKLYQDIKDYPDAFQHERADRLKVSARGISSALKRLGITRKKNFISSKKR